jgi:hypothetical protein
MHAHTARTMGVHTRAYSALNGRVRTALMKTIVIIPRENFMASPRSPMQRGGVPLPTACCAVTLCVICGFECLCDLQDGDAHTALLHCIQADDEDSFVLVSGLSAPRTRPAAPLRACSCFAAAGNRVVSCV